MRTDVVGLDEAKRLADRHTSPRCRKLLLLRSYVRGEQYKGRPDFLSPQQDVPLMERAPNVVTPVVSTAIAQHIDLALGEGRFPTFSTGIADDGVKLDPVVGITPAQSKLLDAFLVQVSESCCLPDVARDAAESAESVGSACVVFATCEGQLRGDVLEPEHCTATLDQTGRVLSLVVEYPFIVEEQGRDGLVRAVCKLYRREIDAQRDVVFEPITLRDDAVPAFGAIQSEVVHGLGFCPVVWYSHRRKNRRANDPDGHAIHATVLDEIDALNFSLSQRHRAALYCGDPQMVETGVSHEEQVGQSGSEPRATLTDLRTTSGGRFVGFGYSERPRSARRKGAGTVWRYESPEAKVTMLSLPGDALKAIDEHCQDLEARIHQEMGYTKASPESVRGAMSGKALAFLFARTTAHCDMLRVELWDGFIRPALSMLLRIVLHAEATAPGSLYIAGVAKASKVLSRFKRTDAAGADRWVCPRIMPSWGRYFERTAEDDLNDVRVSREALDGGLVTREIAIERLRGVFAFDNAAELAKQIEAEKQAAADRAPKLTAPAAPVGKADDSDDEDDDEEPKPDE